MKRERKRMHESDELILLIRIDETTRQKKTL
jgi:hypothetical protein